MPINNKLIFIHIPKNAGTSVTKSISMDDVGHHLPSHYISKYPDKWLNNFKFAIVRDPWDRVVSNYEYARMEESYWHSKTGKSMYEQHPDLDTLKNVTFEECLSILERGELKHQGWKSQHIYTHIDAEFVLDKVFTINELGSDEFKKLVPELVYVNKSDGLNDYKSYYTQETIDKVSSIYKKDIELFNFKYEQY